MMRANIRKVLRVIDWVMHELMITDLSLSANKKLDELVLCRMYKLHPEDVLNLDYCPICAEEYANLDVEDGEYCSIDDNESIGYDGDDKKICKRQKISGRLSTRGRKVKVF